MNIVEEVSSTIPEIKDFLKTQFTILVKNSNYDEILSAHIHPLILADRLTIVKDKINQIINA